jgi:alkylation response protein AidB-like acyl-CoA dehydrogenase
MRFAPTAEQEAFRDTARRFLADRVRVRDLTARPGAHDPALWREIASLGWLGVDVPESLGGQGLGFLETALLAEETGRALLPGPFLGHLLAVQALLVAGDVATIPALVSGETVAATAVAAAPASPPAAVRLVRTRLRGEAVVPCAEAADLIFVAAGSSGGGVVAAARARDCALQGVQTLDLTRPQSKVVFEGAPAVARLEPSGYAAWEDRARVLLAAEAVGGAERALETAIAYAGDREQFGRPIGSFQAVKHRAADAFRALTAARLAARYAAWAIAAGADGAPFAAAAAKATAGDAFVRCAADSIQIHGGIGFTWEHDAHLYYRRALAIQAALGDAGAQRDRIASDVLARA